MKIYLLFHAGLISLLLSWPAASQTAEPAPPPPCVGLSSSHGELDAQVRDLEAKLAALREQGAGKDLDTAPGRQKAQELRETQEKLLDLIFARECKRPDITADAVRGPNTNPPPWVEITTFFATNRKPTGDTAPMQFFGADNPDHSTELQFGRALVSIPTNRQPGTLPLPSLWKFEFAADPARHFIFKSVNLIGADAVHDEMAAAVAGNAEKSVLLFVHGYNVSFADAALRTAQLAHDLPFAGVPMFFSWPSLGTTLGYWHDEEAIQTSEMAFDKLLDTLASIGATELYVIAHSMGNRLVTNVLHDRAVANRTPANLRELLLAAPDINAEVFRDNILPGMAALKGVQRTIYASSNDVALRASEIVHDYRRVGETSPSVLTFAGFETVDASGAAPIFRAFGHSYVMDSAKVLGDIAEVLSLHLSADQRSLPRGASPTGAWWILR